MKTIFSIISLFTFSLFSTVLISQTILPDRPTLPDAISGASSYNAGNNLTFSLNNGVAAIWSWVWTASGGTIPNVENEIGLQLVSNTGIMRVSPNTGNIRQGNNGVYTVAITATAGGNTFTRDYKIAIRSSALDDCGPYEFALVMDASGSMNSQNRWTDLQSAVRSYLPMLNDRVEGTDRLDVYFFQDSTVTPVYNGTFGGITWTDVGNINQHIFPNAVSPGGLTPMGLGLCEAVSGFGNNTNKNIIVFTDGHQNVPPNYDDNTNAIGCPIPQGTIDFDVLNDINIFTIGVANCDQPLLQTLANPSNNTFAHAYSSTELDELFIQYIPAIFRNCSPRILDYRTGTMQGDDVILQEKFVADSLIDDFSILVKLKTPRTTINTNNIQLYKDGNLTPFTGIFNGETLKFFIDLPFRLADRSFLDGGGEWELRFSGTKEGKYEITAIVEDKYVETDLTINNQQALYAGDQIAIQASLHALDLPLEGQKVTAYLFLPGEDPGDLFANEAYNQDPVIPEDTLIAGLSRSSLIAQAKIDWLLGQPDILSRLEKEQRIIQLNDAGDGQYTGTFPGRDNRVTGTYEVVAIFEGDFPGLGQIRGKESVHLYLDFARPEDIDAHENFIRGNTGDGVTRYTIQIKPTNTFGKLLGPGQAQRIKVNLDGGNKLILEDNLDGSYETFVYVPEDSNPSVSIFIIDEKVPVVKRRINNIRFGLSLHAGSTFPLNNTSPLDTSQGNFYWEGDLSFQLNTKLALQLIGGQYRFANDFNISGAGLFLDYTFTNYPINGFHPRVAAGLGIYKPINQSATFGLGLRGGLERPLGANAKIGVDVGIISLPSPNYLFGFGGVSLKYFF